MQKKSKLGGNSHLTCFFCKYGKIIYIYNFKNETRINYLVLISFLFFDLQKDYITTFKKSIKHGLWPLLHFSEMQQREFINLIDYHDGIVNMLLQINLMVIQG